MLFEREVQAPKYPTCLKSMQIPGRKHREQFQKYQTRKKAAPKQQHRFSVRIQGIFYLLQDCYPMLSIHICSSKLKQFGIQNAHQQHTPSIPEPPKPRVLDAWHFCAIPSRRKTGSMEPILVPIVYILAFAFLHRLNMAEPRNPANSVKTAT